MATCISHSPTETEALGETWGRAAASGLVIGLSGDLGAGKTQLVKGLARGLEITTRVLSPTFALVNIYSGGRLALFHLDLYRLENAEQIAAAGLEEHLRPAGVSVIEWVERWFPKSEVQVSGVPFGVPRPAADVSAGRFRWVEFEILSDTERRIAYEDFGD